MSYTSRKPIIERIEQMRSSKVICFVTTIRPGVPGQIADDQVRVVFDHLQSFPTDGVESIDVFLITNGGESTVPWRLVSLIREYSPKLNILIPYKAMSAGSIFALGADEIVMHRLAEMGPIDPTVTNEFNPQHPQTNQYLGISVEDVKSYITFVKETVGIKSEEGIVKALEMLANRVHPLALGNVDRFINQARLVGKKTLRTHMDAVADGEKIEKIIEDMASKLYFHGHPINRKEAVTDLNLAVCPDPPKALEDAMLDLYLDFEAEMEMRVPFNPMNLLNQQKGSHAARLLQAQVDLVNTLAQLQSKQSELALFAADPAKVNLIQAEIQALLNNQAQATAKANEPLNASHAAKLIHACIESTACSERHESTRVYTLVSAATPMGTQLLVNEEIQAQGWNRYQV